MINDHALGECKYSYRYISWWQMFCNNSFYIASHGAAISFLIWTSPLFFFSDLFTYQLDLTFFWPLNLLPSTCFPVSSGLFLVLWMLVTVHKIRVANNNLWNNIYGKPFWCVRGVLINYHRTFIKKLFGGTSSKSDEKKLECQLQSFLRLTQTQWEVCST